MASARGKQVEYIVLHRFCAALVFRDAYDSDERAPQPPPRAERLDSPFGARIEFVALCSAICYPDCFLAWPLPGPTPGASRNGPDRPSKTETNAPGGGPKKPPGAFFFWGILRGFFGTIWGSKEND